MRAARFTLSGAAVADEERPRTLATQLTDARRVGELNGLRTLMARTFDLPDGLTRVVERLVADPRHHGTVSALLHDAGVGRRTFACQARRAGFVPPLRFLQVTRVLAATLVVQHGSTAEAAAEYLGYSSADTMRRHFLAVYGAPPRAARALGAEGVAARIRDRLVGSSGGSCAPPDMQLSLAL